MISQLTDKSNPNIFHMWLTTLKFDIDKYYLMYTAVKSHTSVSPNSPGYAKSWKEWGLWLVFLFYLCPWPFGYNVYIFKFKLEMKVVGWNKFSLHIYTDTIKINENYSRILHTFKEHTNMYSINM